MQIKWYHLLSGTDVRGIACGNPAEVTLTDAAAGAIARSFAHWLSVRVCKPAARLKVAVGYDCRVSSPHLNGAICGALSAYGASVLAAGMSSTPAMFNMLMDMSLDGAIQITASHHPSDRNGMKFFTKQGGIDGKDLVEILDFCAEHESGPADDSIPAGAIQHVDYMPRYAKKLRDMIISGVDAEDRGHPLNGFKIAVDAGNGVGGFYAGQVLEPLGADVSGSVFLEPDGSFPNHMPNPENPDAMAAMREAVVSSHSDLGIIFDTDVDRAAVVDGTGEEINRNRLIALAAAIALEECPGGTIVTDSVTSSGLKDFIEKDLGGKHYRYRRGYRNVILKAYELCDQGVNCPLAIETSGHAAMRENFFLDDGAYLATKIVIKLAKLRAEGRDLASLTASLAEPLEEIELRLPVLAADFRERGKHILGELGKMAELCSTGWHLADDNREGLRIYEANGTGWFMLRTSVHDPVMPVNIESSVKGGCRHMARELLIALECCGGLDLTPLIDYCNS